MNHQEDITVEKSYESFVQDINDSEKVENVDDAISFIQNAN